jgi:glycosidase
MLDRFSDGREQGFRGNDGQLITSGSPPLFQPGDAGNAIQTEADAAAWREAGAHWVGGNLKGLASKIGYLKRLGVTALWISPVFRQVPYQDTYHGYGIQNFLDVDPHFGTRQDLKSLVQTAHRHGIYVILDIIMNLSGNVFSYDADRYWTQDPATGREYFDPRWDGNPYRVAGFHDASGHPGLPGTVWVDLDAGMLPASRHFTCLYATDAAQIGQALTVQTVGDRQAVQLTVPAAGFVMFE